MNKVLIFTASMGSGHITAAHGLRDRFANQGKTVEVIDVLPWTCAGLLSRWLFGWLGKHAQWVLEGIFYASSRPLPTWFDIFFYGLWTPHEKAKSYFTNLEDIYEVWTTFPALSLALQKYWKQEIHVQITDYTTPHLSWMWGENVVLHALDEESKTIIVQTDKSKKVQVGAFPLPHRFYEAVQYSEEKKQAIRKNLHFLPEEKIIIFFFHHVLLGGEQALVEKFLHHKDYQTMTMVIITGNHSLAFLPFKKYHNVRLETWISNIQDYYAIAEIVCGKCGGAFISEVMLFQHRLCVSGVFSGQEKGNNEFLQKYYKNNLIAVTNDVGDL